MGRNVTKTKIYSVEWGDRLYFISLNFIDNILDTQHYRPQFLKDINNTETSISEEEFLGIWTKFIIGISVCSDAKDIIERYIGALTFTVMDAITQKGTISFEDLLNHVDCFSMMLKDEGISDDKIKALYVTVTKAILSNFKERIIDMVTGENLINTPKYQEIERLINEKR